jgi:hypothetical protein
MRYVDEYPLYPLKSGMGSSTRVAEDVREAMTVNRRRILDARLVFHPSGLSSITY